MHQRVRQQLELDHNGKSHEVRPGDAAGHPVEPRHRIRDERRERIQQHRQAEQRDGQEPDEWRLHDRTEHGRFVGLSLNSGVKGAGILVIQDGDMKNFGTLEWDGLVIVTGSYTGLGLMNGSTTTIRGAAIAYEAQAGEAAGYFELYLGTVNSASIRSSKQDLDMVQLMRSMHSITNWREV